MTTQESEVDLTNQTKEPSTSNKLDKMAKKKKQPKGKQENGGSRERGRAERERGKGGKPPTPQSGWRLRMFLLEFSFAQGFSFQLVINNMQLHNLH